MLQTGTRMPDAVVQQAPGEDVHLADLLADGPILLLFYLFDWSST